MNVQDSTRSHSTRSLKELAWEWVGMGLKPHIPLPFSVVPRTGGNGWERVGTGAHFHPRLTPPADPEITALSDMHMDAETISQSELAGYFQ